MHEIVPARPPGACGVIRMARARSVGWVSPFAAVFPQKRVIPRPNDWFRPGSAP
jgi:hypothetical protein